MADFRDPSVSWDAAAHHWIMAVSLPKEHKVRLYSSPNLKQWTQLSDFGPAGDTAGDWECPDLLRIPSSTGKTSIWALKVGLNPGAPQGGSGEQYFLGSFDGKAFTQSNAARLARLDQLRQRRLLRHQLQRPAKRPESQSSSDG